MASYPQVESARRPSAVVLALLFAAGTFAGIAAMPHVDAQVAAPQDVLVNGSLEGASGFENGYTAFGPSAANPASCNGSGCLTPSPTAVANPLPASGDAQSYNAVPPGCVPTNNNGPRCYFGDPNSARYSRFYVSTQGVVHFGDLSSFSFEYMATSADANAISWKIGMFLDDPATTDKSPDYCVLTDSINPSGATPSVFVPQTFGTSQTYTVSASTTSPCNGPVTITNQPLNVLQANPTFRNQIVTDTFLQVQERVSGVPWVGGQVLVDHFALKVNISPASAPDFLAKFTFTPALKTASGPPAIEAFDFNSATPGKVHVDVNLLDDAGNRRYYRTESPPASTPDAELILTPLTWVGPTTTCSISPLTYNPSDGNADHTASFDILKSTLTASPCNAVITWSIRVRGTNEPGPTGSPKSSYYNAQGRAAMATTPPDYASASQLDTQGTPVYMALPGITVTPVPGTLAPALTLETSELPSDPEDSFTVKLDSAPLTDVTVKVTASVPAECMVMTGAGPAAATLTLTFTQATWDTAQTVQLVGQNDNVDDGDQACNVTTEKSVSNDPAYNGIGPTTLSVKNLDDDVVGIIVNAAAGLTTTEGGGTATFTVILGSQPTADVNVPLASSKTSEGTIAPLPSLVFTATNWNVAQTVTLTGVADSLDDGNQAYVAQTGDPTSSDTLYNALAASDVADVALTNLDGDVPWISVNSVAVSEGNSGATTLVFTVTMSVASISSVSVDYATSDGTAKAGSDYTAQAGTVTFPIGSTSQTVSINVLTDTVDEGNETFRLVLSKPVGGNPSGEASIIGTGTGIGTITNDDKARLSLFAPHALDVPAGPPDVDEGNVGTTLMTYTVKLATTADRPISFVWTAAGVLSPAPSATAADFVGAVFPTGSVTIPAGSTIATFDLPVKTDTMFELDEGVRVTLSSLMVGTTPDASYLPSPAYADARITNDDQAPIATIAPKSVTEGDMGTANLVFTVTLSQASGLDATINYQVKTPALPAPAATSGVDFTAPSGTLTIPAGATTGSIIVLVRGDVLDEANEQLLVVLDPSPPTNPTYNLGTPSIGVGTILDDDIVTVSVADFRATEADSTNVAMPFTVTLDRASSSDIQLTLGTVGYGAAPASTSDVAVLATCKVPAGFFTTTCPGSISILGDLLDEDDEQFTLTMTILKLDALTTTPSAPQDAVAAATPAIGTIVDNDAIPALSVTDVSVIESHYAGINAVFAVSLGAASGRQVTVLYGTTPGPTPAAESGVDYAPMSGTLTFSAGTKVLYVSVPITGDAVVEPAEHFTLTLTSPTNSYLGDGSGLGTIVPNQAPVAKFNATTNATQEQRTVSFIDLSSDSDGYIVAWRWDFGDATTAFGRTARHDYPTTGPYTVTLTVMDNYGEVDAMTRDIQVSIVDHPTAGPTPAGSSSSSSTTGYSGTAPVANAGQDRTVKSGQEVKLDGLANGVHEGFFFAWRQTSGRNVTLSDPTSATPSFTAPTLASGQSITLVFDLQVSDGSHTSAVDKVTITVTHTALAPIASAGPTQAVIAGQLVQLTGAGSSDPEGLPLTWTWTQITGKHVNLADNATATPSFVAPADADAEVYGFELRVSNGLKSAVDTVQVMAAKAPLPLDAQRPVVENVTQAAPGEIHSNIEARLHKGTPAPAWSLVALALLGMAARKRATRKQ